jgi:phosphohistidine phosphatase SixA
MLRHIIIALAALVATSSAFATEAGWALLRDGGHVVLIQHANAPGMGDPQNFDVEDCSTQRNLSDRGRQQARRMGVLFAARAAPVERVLSSRWCRALDTAGIAFGQSLVEPFEPLDLLPDDKTKQAEQNAAVIEIVRGYSGSGNLVMVTHRENILALTGMATREGEATIVSPDGEGLRAVGRILFN